MSKENTVVVSSIKEQWYHYLIGFLLILLSWQFLGSYILKELLVLELGSQEKVVEQISTQFKDSTISKNKLLFYFLINYVIGFLVLALVWSGLHKGTLKNLVTPFRSSVDYKRIFFSFILVVIFSVSFTAIDIWCRSQHLEWNFNWQNFSILFLISSTLLVIQTTFEELFFRGYIFRMFSFKGRLGNWFPYLVTSFVFGLVHCANPEVSKLGLVAYIIYFSSGFFLGALMVMDGGLELSIGYHAANNFITALLITNDWSAFQTDALFVDHEQPTPDSFYMLLPYFIVFFLLIVIFSKKYQWKSFKQQFFNASI